MSHELDSVTRKVLWQHPSHLSVLEIVHVCGVTPTQSTTVAKAHKHGNGSYDPEAW